MNRMVRSKDWSVIFRGGDLTCLVIFLSYYIRSICCCVALSLKMLSLHTHSNIHVLWSNVHTILLFPPGSFVTAMDSPSFLAHSQPMDGQMTSEPRSPPPEGEGLKSTLVRQLEYYFSKENLSSDKYLCKCVRDIVHVLYI